ncbi:M15 family metallopeptidase [Patescibacteria group bacterium]|nr:M15 family metallopeptidase [Patescibacteria group bacterium]
MALDINPAKNPFTMTKKGRIPTDMPKEFVNIFRKH